jgi:DNA-binding CsgD family transcriptional regulator/ketosteroid isomerase-like protein
LRSLAEVASCHHERLDGSGYFRGSRGSSLSVHARILAAADVYQTKTENRPHRDALTADEAAAHLSAEADAGRLDRLAVDAVLATAGKPRPARHPRLTPREIEILAEVARGGSMREIARTLSISPKTVDGHLQRIYPKIGVSTRAGATLYTLEHGLLPNVVRPERGGELPVVARVAPYQAVAVQHSTVQGGHTMSTLLSLVLQHYDALGRGDLDSIEELFDPGVETMTPNGTLKGIEEFRALGEAFRAAMSDMRHEIVRTFELGDTVVVEAVFSGIHTGPLVGPEGGIPPTGNAVAFPFAGFLQYRDGKCVSHRIYWDNVTLMAQLGATP